MSSIPQSHYSFDGFELDVANRQLWRDGQQIDLNGRYFDALVLLVSDHGHLIAKDLFFREVWDEVFVSDSALTQCIKELRKKLGDDALNPKYIKTIPGYGYRFIGQVEVNLPVKQEQKSSISEHRSEEFFSLSKIKIHLKRGLIIGGGGALGGIVAGLLGGLFYGLGLVYAPGDAGMGALSMLLVLIAINIIIGGVGGLGVSVGMAIAIVFKDSKKIWTVIGAAFGGLAVGSLTKLLGMDAFNLLFGVVPEGITGGVEGAVLGAAVGLGVILSGGLETDRKIRPIVAAASVSGIAGVLITIAGGRLMSGSLEILTNSFSDSQLRMDVMGRFFGEMDYGTITQTILTGVEGFLFGACVVGAIVYIQERLSKKGSDTF
jgi:DNA-binding winged helix-turn-helix (wHTH) protein